MKGGHMGDLGRVDAAIDQIKSNPKINCEYTGQGTLGCTDEDKQLNITIFQGNNSTIITKINNVNDSIFTVRDLNGDGRIDQSCIGTASDIKCTDAKD